MRNVIFITSSSSSGYLPETLAYIAATGYSFTTPQSDGIDRWFRDVLGYSNGSYSTYNVFSRIQLAYLSLTGTYTADRVNAVSPGTYNYTDTGSPTYSTSAGTLNVAYNGSSQYSDTGFTPNGLTTFASSDMTGFGYHRVDTNSDSNATMGEVGGGNSFMVIGSAFKTITSGAQTAYNQADASAINGLWFTSWSNSSTVNSYYNGANIKAVSVSFNNTPTRSFYLGAFHSSSPGYGGPNTQDFHIEVKGAWSDAEAQLIYNATKALKSVFGVTWL